MGGWDLGGWADECVDGIWAGGLMSGWMDI